MSPEILNTIQRIIYPSSSAPVYATAAEEIRAQAAPQAIADPSDQPASVTGRGVLRLGIAKDEGFPAPEGAPDDKCWTFVQFDAEKGGCLLVSHRHLLFGLACLVLEQGDSLKAEELKKGVLRELPFVSVLGFDGHYGFWRRFARGYDPEAAMRETARLGCCFMPVNALPSPFSFEQGPIGEIYWRFYQYLPDIDQYVDSRLNHGIYPPEYLEANLHFLKEQATRAVRYGLTPGMQIANPRSAPEEFFQRYPYLRGPRIDHTFRCYQPRYTMTLAHPLVRWHYATLLEKLMKEVPQLGFLSTLVNDSGSGFEYTESLYPGRNGGPYLIREWRPHNEIARAASRLIIQYYRTMRDVGRQTNPEFRLLVCLNNIEEEKGIIYDGIDDGLDRLARTQRYDSREDDEISRSLERRGSRLISYTSGEGNPYILGIPSPWRTHANIEREREAGTVSMELDFDPVSSSPFDVNRAVIRNALLAVGEPLEALLECEARELTGEERAEDLLALWKASDRIVECSPVWPLYGNQGFSWYRMWTRPLVPDIAKIPVADRAYYEDYILTHFNNPHNVDFKADALWEIHTREEMQEFLQRYDTEVLPLQRETVEKARRIVESLESGAEGRAVFVDYYDRMRAFYHYNRMFRNVAAWIVGVHGYLQATSDAEREDNRALVQSLIDDELENAKELLELWRSTTTVFMPIHERGEWMHDYGPNFATGLEKKIRLMEQYRDHPPYIDPNYLWRLPHKDEVELAPDVSPEEYLKFL